MIKGELIIAQIGLLPAPVPDATADGTACGPQNQDGPGHPLPQAMPGPSRELFALTALNLSTPHHCPASGGS